jgi:glycosyltransferase involved in cell wall biosynthesis
VRVDYLSCRAVRSGGTKILAQHVRLLRARGHEARILTTDPAEAALWDTPLTRVGRFDREAVAGADVVVASWPKDVVSAVRIAGVPVCHLCQGYEPIEFSFRVSQERIPPQYRFSGLWGRVLFWQKQRVFRRRIRRTEAIYRLPTVKLVVSEALEKVIRELYGDDCYLVPNGVDPGLFRPPTDPIPFAPPLRLLSVGPIAMAFKGIDDTLEAVRILKQRGDVPVEFTRVSLAPPSEMEIRSGLVDRFLTSLGEEEMANLYRQTHLLIAPSLWEGFGLPAVEAMSCGVPCILTDSGSYSRFETEKDFACFVPPRSPERIAEGVLRLSRDRAFREEIVRRGFEVAGRYTLERMGDRLEAALCEIVGKAREGGIRR